MRRACVLLALLVLVAGGFADAQGLRVSQPGPDCHLTRKAWDNPYDDTHSYLLPRYQWHAVYGAASLATGYALHRFTRLPNWVVALAPTVAFGVLPHIRGGLIKRTYPINPLDWTFDLWTRAGPVFWVVAHHDDTAGVVWKHHAEATGTSLVGYAALACWASP